MFTGEVPQEKAQHREVMKVLRKMSGGETTTTVNVEAPVVNITVPENRVSYEFIVDRDKSGKISKVIARPLDE